MDSRMITRQQPGYVLEKIDQNILLYHPGESSAVHLNEIAALVWELADGTRSVGEIVDLMESAFPGMPSLSDSVHETLEELVNSGAVAVMTGAESEASQ